MRPTRTWLKFTPDKSPRTMCLRNIWREIRPRMHGLGRSTPNFAAPLRRPVRIPIVVGLIMSQLPTYTRRQWSICTFDSFQHWSDGVGPRIRGDAAAIPSK